MKKKGDDRGLGGTRHTEQSEKHVTVYPLEYGFQVT